MYILSFGMKACENYSRNGPLKHLVASFNNSETREKCCRLRKLEAAEDLGEKTRNGRAPHGTRPFILTPIARRQP